MVVVKEKEKRTLWVNMTCVPDDHNKFYKSGKTSHSQIDLMEIKSIASVHACTLFTLLCLPPISLTLSLPPSPSSVCLPSSPHTPTSSPSLSLSLTPSLCDILSLSLSLSLPATVSPSLLHYVSPTLSFSLPHMLSPHPSLSLPLSHSADLSLSPSPFSLFLVQEKQQSRHTLHWILADHTCKQKKKKGIMGLVHVHVNQS